jgi:hypothetical protein
VTLTDLPPEPPAPDLAAPDVTAPDLVAPDLTAPDLLRPMPRLRLRGRADADAPLSIPFDVAERQVALLVVAAAASGRLIGPPVAWLVAALVGLSALAGASRVVSLSAPLRTGAHARPAQRLVSGVLPATLATAGAVAVHALPARLDLVAGLGGLALLVAWSVGLERRLVLARGVPSDEDVAAVLGLSLAAAFIAFVGAGTLVAGGLAGSGGQPMAVTDLVVLVTADALAAGALGLRMARLRAAGRRNAVLGGVSSAAIVAVAAGGLRALAVPFLLGPALLTLVFFLWDAVTGSTVARRRSPRWAWEIVLLAILGLCVVLLNLRVG